jgi:L-alanine-DL-glutamate epimerase-like enolase superfamily enzyme
MKRIFGSINYRKQEKFRMKITKLSAVSLEYDKIDPPMSRSFAVIRVETEDGIVGYGEASASYGHYYPTVVQAIVNDVIAPVLIGKDAHNIDGRVEDMHQLLDLYLGWDGVSNQSISAVEIALWDILGKVRQEPIYKLLGGKAQSMPLYATGTAWPGQSFDWHAHYFDDCLAHGFGAIKVRLDHEGLGIPLVARVREHIGADILLGVDAYSLQDTETALELASDLEPYNIFFFEEPLPQYNFAGLAQIKRQSTIPVATGERVFSKHTFDRVIEMDAADFFQPDPTLCGGIRAGLEMCKIAQQHGMKVIPHVGGLTGIGLAATLQMAIAAGCDRMEYDIDPYQPLREELLVGAPFALDKIENGELTAPLGPGLGIEIDEAVFSKYPYTGSPAFPQLYGMRSTESGSD